MRAYIRRFSAILFVIALAAPLAAPLGAVPLQAFGAITSESVLAALDREQLGLSLDRGLLGTALSSPRLAGLDLFASNFGLSTSVGSAPAGPVEVIIGLEGNSLAAEQVRREQAGLAPLDGDGQRAYVAALRDAQADVIATLEAGGAKVRHDYQIVFNGLAAVIEGDQLMRILGLPGVRSIEPDQIVTPALDKSVPFIFGGKTNAELGADGLGVTIAIIDTGIDYTHAGLGGSGVVADYVLNDPTIIELGTFPTAKVIGGTDLVGEFYSAGCPPIPDPTVCSSIPFPDPDPLDLHGHGSHVSGIAAGIGTVSVSTGVAPGASLLALKVFALGSSSFSVIIAAIELATDPNGDGDTSDAVDVINMSLGSPYGRGTSADAIASDAAVDLGVIVVASAGNDGDLPYVTGSPATASKAISVAAGNDPGIEVQLVEAGGTDGADGDYEALPAAFTPPLSDFGVLSGDTVFVGNACSALAPDSLDGMIPLIIRGSCRFDLKISNAEAAGAIAAVVFNNIPGAGPITMGGAPIVDIPGFMIVNDDGVLLAGALLPGSTLTLDPANTMSIPDRLQGFTSRGPRFGDSVLKPDITAPGGAIASVLVGSGTGALSISGTSMSSPHIAGAAALMRQLHPDWSVEEIKAVLMNTATDVSPNGLPYPVSRMGAGRVQVDVAVDTESVVVPASASFGVEERDREGKKTFKVKLELRNNGDDDKKFELSSAFLFPDDDEGSIELKHPEKLKVKAGESKKFTFKLKVNFDLLAPDEAFEEYDGFLTLTETSAGGDVLRVPWHIIPYARAAGEVDDDDLELPDDDELELENDGIRDTLVDIYQFGVFDPIEELIFEAPGAPNDPDDWFDIRHTGAHAFDVSFGRILEFAMTTHGSRSVANFMETDVFIDVDGGGPDYVIVAADRGAFIGAFPTGDIVSAIFELRFGFGFFTGFGVADDRNTAIQTIPFLLDSPLFLSLNLIGEVFGGPTIDAGDPDFDYFVVTFDFETGASDITDTASFNAIAPEIDTFPNFLLLPAGEEVEVDVLASVEGGILILFYNNVSGPDQSQAVEVEFDDDEDDD